MAAVLACGRAAVLSHRSGGALLDLRRSERTAIDVTAPGRSRRGQRGIHLHSPRSLHPEDVTVVDGIPVTSVARTLLDLAEVIPPIQLRRAFEQAERMGVLDHAALARLIGRSGGRRGLRHLTPLMAVDHSTAARARSDLEARFLDFLRDRGLPVPVVNAVVAGYDVDAHWPGTRLVVELDSWRFHSGRGEFDRDRHKWLRPKAPAMRSCR